MMQGRQNLPPLKYSPDNHLDHLDVVCNTYTALVQHVEVVIVNCNHAWCSNLVTML